MNDEDFDLLVRQFRTKIFRLIFSIVREAPHAEDLTQEVLMRVWRARDRYDRDRASMGTWLYAIARNTALNSLRSQGYRHTVSLEAADELSAPSKDAGFRHDVRKSIEQLPDDQKQVLEQYYFQDRSVEETALALGMPGGTVKSHLFRARRALAAILGASR